MNQGHRWFKSFKSPDFWKFCLWKQVIDVAYGEEHPLDARDADCSSGEDSDCDVWQIDGQSPDVAADYEK